MLDCVELEHVELGFDELEKHFTKIFTTDSFKTIENDNCIQIELGKLL